MLELAASLGIPAAEKTLGRFDLFAAEEAFLSGTGAGIVPIRSLDSRAIGEGVPEQEPHPQDDQAVPERPRR